MKLGQFIEVLSKFDPELEATLFDGFEGRRYKPQNGYDIVVQEFEGVLDIGIGGMLEYTDEDEIV